MEKIILANLMSRTWSCAPSALNIYFNLGLVGIIAGTYISAAYISFAAIPVFYASLYVYYHFIYLQTEAAPTHKYIEFKDASLKRKYQNNKIPVSIFYESYIDGLLDIKGDVLETLNARHEFISWKITGALLKFLIRQLIPITGVSESFHSQADDKAQIEEHYDRGNDFFRAFLGPLMVYTSGIFHNLDQTLEQAQENKMDLICQKLGVKPGDSYLDIGCGWGTLARHAAKNFGAQATAVSLSSEQVKYANDECKKLGLSDKVTNIVQDYRDIKNTQFKNISAIEMAEHVGLFKMQEFLGKVRSLLTDDGQFLMQVAGLRKGSNWEDLNWGLFMSKYIFPGADASTPLHWYVEQIEKSGMEVWSVENIGIHYSHTIHRWYNNWKENTEDIKAKYGERWVRLWLFFLAWSVITPGQGGGFCWQILAHKNEYGYDRNVHIGEPHPGWHPRPKTD